MAARAQREARVVAGRGLDLLSALATAHGQGAPHRDVEPENVMVTGTGQVVLTEDGVRPFAARARGTRG